MVGNRLFIIGGNLNFNIVTKKCQVIDLDTLITDSIASLNFPSASHSLLTWKNRFIYKFGGIGSCFGEWDLSPYIECYHLETD